jgi:hypothetical protein
MKKLILILCLAVPVASGLKSQESTSSKVELSGYLSGMPSIILMYIPEPGRDSYQDSILWQGLIHNRINIDWYPSASLTGSVQIRNQFIAGNMIEETESDQYFYTDGYALPLTFKKAFSDKYFLSMSIDRAWIQYTYKNFEIRAGRQRINWGQTFVWNPNDLFNSYNFFDFDYPERPGADAFRLQYYPNYNSAIDLAVKADSSGDITGGGLYRFTKWNTEFQILGGYFQKSNERKMLDGSSVRWDDRDLIAGLGFSAGIKSVSLRGEMSYLHSVKEGVDSTNQFMTSLTVDYTLSNQLGMMFEVLYVNNILHYAYSFEGLYRGNQSIKTLAFTKYNLFGQISYPVIPILTISAGGMYFFDEDLQGVFLGPSIELSLGNNLMLSSYYQFFTYQTVDQLNQKDRWVYMNYGFLRLKWNF